MQQMNIGDYNMKVSYNNPDDYWYYHYECDNDFVGSMKGCLYSLIGIIIMVIISLLFGSCSTQYVPVETIKTEYKTNTVHDSVFVETVKHDSVAIIQKGDTVFVSKWHTLYKDRWREKLITDTVIKVDSVQVPYPVERKLTKWEQAKMDMGGIAISGLVVIVIILLLKWFIKKRLKV